MDIIEFCEMVELVPKYFAVVLAWLMAVDALWIVPPATVYTLRGELLYLAITLPFVFVIAFLLAPRDNSINSSGLFPRTVLFFWQEK